MSFAQAPCPPSNVALRFSDSTPAKSPPTKTRIVLRSLTAGYLLVFFVSFALAQERPAKAETAAEWAQKGYRLMHQGDLDGAIKACTKAIELDPRMAAAYSNRGLARSYKGDFDGGIADSTKAIELNPKDPFPFINRANARIRKGVDPDASIADAKKALELRPGIPAAWNNLGMASDQKGDYKGALDAFDKALELLPTWGQGHAQRAQTRMKMKQWDKAENDLTRALELHFVRPGIYQNRAVCRMEQGNNKGAIDDYTEVLRRKPGNALFYYYRSRAAFASRDVKAAQADLDKALGIAPALAPLHSLRAKILLHEGDGDGALAVAERFVSAQPKSPDALKLRALIHAWHGEQEKAAADYAAALKLAPKQPASHLLRGWFYLSGGQADKAAEEADAGLKLAGGKHALAPYLTILAHCARRHKHPDQARRAVEDQIKEGKDHWPAPVLRYLHGDMSAEELLHAAADNDQRTEARAYAGVALWASGGADKACEHLQWVRDNGNPDFIEFDLALMLLRRLEGERTRKP